MWYQSGATRTATVPREVRHKLPGHAVLAVHWLQLLNLHDVTNKGPMSSSQLNCSTPCAVPLRIQRPPAGSTPLPLEYSCIYPEKIDTAPICICFVLYLYFFPKELLDWCYIKKLNCPNM